MLTGKRKKVLMFIAIKLNCRMSQLMIQLKVNTETMKFMVCIYSREHLMTLNRNQKNSSTLKGVLFSHADARMILARPPSPPPLGRLAYERDRNARRPSFGHIICRT